ncbi:hypothetical protein V2J09_012797 [Rumex salicifolius]
MSICYLNAELVLSAGKTYVTLLRHQHVCHGKIGATWLDIFVAGAMDKVDSAKFGLSTSCELQFATDIVFFAMNEERNYVEPLFCSGISIQQAQEQNKNMDMYNVSAKYALKKYHCHQRIHPDEEYQEHLLQILEACSVRRV